VIDGRKLLEKCITWRQSMAHEELSRGSSWPADAAAHARGMYKGVALVEQWVQEIINEAEKEEKNRG